MADTVDAVRIHQQRFFLMALFNKAVGGMKAQFNRVLPFAQIRLHVPVHGNKGAVGLKGGLPVDHNGAERIKHVAAQMDVFALQDLCIQLKAAQEGIVMRRRFQRFLLQTADKRVFDLAGCNQRAEIRAGQHSGKRGAVIAPQRPFTGQAKRFHRPSHTFQSFFHFITVFSF